MTELQYQVPSGTILSFQCGQGVLHEVKIEKACLLTLEEIASIANKQFPGCAFVKNETLMLDVANVECGCARFVRLVVPEESNHAKQPTLTLAQRMKLAQETGVYPTCLCMLAQGNPPALVGICMNEVKRVVDNRLICDHCLIAETESSTVIVAGYRCRLTDESARSNI